MINSFGKFISLMIPVMTILMIVIIVARYFFDVGLTGLQEGVRYFHARGVVGCAGYVFSQETEAQSRNADPSTLSCYLVMFSEEIKSLAQDR